MILNCVFGDRIGVSNVLEELEFIDSLTDTSKFIDLFYVQTLYLVLRTLR